MHRGRAGDGHQGTQIDQKSIDSLLIRRIPITLHRTSLIGFIMSTSRARWDQVKRDYLEWLNGFTGSGFMLQGRRGARWATSPMGKIAILGSKDHGRDGLWWFGLKEAEFTDDALGLVLLCEGEGTEVFDICLPGSEVRRLFPLLSIDASARERKLHVVRRDERIFLRPEKGPMIEVTGKRSEVSWLKSAAVLPGVPVSVQAESRNEPTPFTLGFYARVHDGRLEPLDGIGLAEGELVMARVTRVNAVPSAPSLRRIAARGGPASLPADFAERHDHYIRESRRL